MPVDLFSILTRKDNKRSLSFMSQCVGLMADLDLGTEHLRFLGATRFVYGYLRGGKHLPLALTSIFTALFADPFCFLNFGSVGFMVWRVAFPV